MRHARSITAGLLTLGTAGTATASTQTTAATAQRDIPGCRPAPNTTRPSERQAPLTVTPPQPAHPPSPAEHPRRGWFVTTPAPASCR
jgi:hypothetical protein